MTSHLTIQHYQAKQYNLEICFVVLARLEYRSRFDKSNILQTRIEILKNHIKEN